jgi:hypothetical protein
MLRSDVWNKDEKLGLFGAVRALSLLRSQSSAQPMRDQPPTLRQYQDLRRQANDR